MMETLVGILAILFVVLLTLVNVAVWLFWTGLLVLVCVAIGAVALRIIKWAI